jgi:hypothetical protein
MSTSCPHTRVLTSLGGTPQEVPERRRATVTVGPRQHALEVAAGDESADLRPLGAAGQLARRRSGGDVEERAGDAGHLDAMAHGPVTRIDLARAMGAHPRDARPGLRPTTVTSTAMRARSCAGTPHRAAADAWLSSAPSPQDSTAAASRASGTIRGSRGADRRRSHGPSARPHQPAPGAVDHLGRLSGYAS